MRSKKKTIVALSTIDSEYSALSTAAREIILIKSLAGNVGLASSVVCLNGYEQTALQIAQDSKLTEASKYISIYYPLIREKADQGDIILQYVPFVDNRADIWTKGLGGKAHVKLTTLIGIDMNITCARAEEE